VKGIPLGVGALVLVALVSCSNDPYPEADSELDILYTVFREAPRTLDPAVAYDTNGHAITGPVYETLLEYDYLKRPYQLIPGLARAVPESEARAGGRVAYVFDLRPGMLFQDDCAFVALGAPPDCESPTTREVVAADFAFELARLADPEVNSPVVQQFGIIVGFRDFAGRLKALRGDDPAFGNRPIKEQYAAAGPIEGVTVQGDHRLEILLQEPYPQILYWFAMPFTTAVPWEAVEYYDGQEGRPRFADHPVGMGAYLLSSYDKQFRIVLERNPNWYGVRHPEWNAPGAVYPSEGEPVDVELGRLSPELAGRPLPFIERVEFRREKESIPTFNKFLQGYYDKSGIIKESFDKVIQSDRLSPQMAEMGIQLDKTVQLSVFYIGLNQEDPILGRAAGEKSRKLRHAMSLAVNSEEYIELFHNGLGLAAQSPLPPGLFGHDPDYRNPFRQVDLERAKALLVEAGYPGGIDPATGKPLHLNFDTYATTSSGLIQTRFFVNAWRSIGLDVEIQASNYNQFQEKVKKGTHQIYQWGWIADYPDPENFLFLLTSELAVSKSGGPNSSNFSDPRYDALFLEMKSRPSDERRFEIIREMVAILERERPWIELFHAESYGLIHGWMKHVKRAGLALPTVKYQDIDSAERARMRAEWNRPVMWPAYVLLLLFVAIVAPGIVTFFRERQ